MCGRYTLKTPTPKLSDHFGVQLEFELPPRYNIAPTTDVLAIYQLEDIRRAEMFHWGLIPAWAKDRTVGAKLSNARCETAAEKPSFRTALRQRRCLIAADGFYEWRTEAQGKQPYYFTLTDGGVFALGGLWETWRSPDPLEPRSLIHSCTILTTTPNQLLSQFHDRMPVIIPPERYADWLDPRQSDPELLGSLMVPYTDGELQARRVNKLVNSVKNQGPELIAEAEADEDPISDAPVQLGLLG